MASPLADKLRPRTLEDVVGQSHLLAQGQVLRSIIEGGTIPNMIFYGPSGVGKTTVANIIANKAGKKLYRLNGTTASTADIKEIVSQLDTFEGRNGVVLYLDEIQYLKTSSRICWNSLRTAASPSLPPPPKTPISMSTMRCSAGVPSLSSSRWNRRKSSGLWNGPSGSVPRNIPA